MPTPDQGDMKHKITNNWTKFKRVKFSFILKFLDQTQPKLGYCRQEDVAKLFIRGRG